VNKSRSVAALKASKMAARVLLPVPGLVHSGKWHLNEVKRVADLTAGQCQWQQQQQQQPFCSDEVSCTRRNRSDVTRPLTGLYVLTNNVGPAEYLTQIPSLYIPYPSCKATGLSLSLVAKPPTCPYL
jgi:hypothetical protein